MFILDFQFWNFSSWTSSQTSAFWTALTGIITALTLGYALWKDRQNNKKINDLANITGRLTDLSDYTLQQLTLLKLELKYSGRPYLEAQVVDNPTQTDITVTVKISNSGAIATITNIVPTSPNVNFEAIALPNTIEPNQSVAFRMRSTSNSALFRTPFNFELHFTDGYGNNYKKTYRTSNFRISTSAAIEIP